jgi:DnaJ family protein C protein 17
MAQNSDLKEHAASSQDFYALLGISPVAAESEIRRAYRRAALKYHPDKISNPTPVDIDKFHLLQIANDVLSDPDVRQLYDNAREARERKKRETHLMDAAKRKMKEDLEARERAGDAAAGQKQRGMKRGWMSTADNDAEEKLEREIQRIAEDTRRRRREAEEKLMREEEEEQQQEQQQQEKQEQDKASQYVDRSKEGGTNVPELERAVKVRWIREGLGVDLDKDRLMSLFVSFGKVENAFMLKDKRQRVGDKREKKTVATGVVVFSSIVSAHAAVLDSEKKRKTGGGYWAIVESVFWASGNEPSIESDRQPTPTSNTATATTTDTTTKPSVSKPQPSFNFASLKERGTPLKSGGGKPSFGSFSPANVKKEAPPSVSADKPGLTTASLQEVTLMRLKNAQREKERKALEENLRREDEAADAAA